MRPPTSLDPPGFVRIGNDIWIVEANKPESPPTTDVGALDTASPTYVSQTPSFTDPELTNSLGLSSYLAGVSVSPSPSGLL